MMIRLQPGQEVEICTMLTECCSQERTYLRYYSLLAQRFCFIDKAYAQLFDEVFMKQYSTIHRLETNKLRNVAKFFAHLLSTDAISWTCMAAICKSRRRRRRRPLASSSRFSSRSSPSPPGLHSLNDD